MNVQIESVEYDMVSQVWECPWCLQEEGQQWQNMVGINIYQDLLSQIIHMEGVFASAFPNYHNTKSIQNYLTFKLMLSLGQAKYSLDIFHG